MLIYFLLLVINCFQALDIRSKKKNKTKENSLCKLAFVSVFTYFFKKGFSTDITVLIVSLFEEQK